MVTVNDLRNQSKREKDAVVEQRYSKPTTNTSGTATASSGAAESFGRRFSAAMKAGVDVFSAGMVAMQPSKTVRGRGGKPYNAYEQEFKQEVRAGKYATPTPAPAPPSTGSGINAPPPDQPWRPSGGMQASGLEQKTAGIPLQEEVGVTKRRRKTS